MTYRRGSIIAVPYEYSNLMGSKVRPAVVVSSETYNTACSDLVAAGITSQMTRVGPYDYVLADWSAAGLRYPSLIRARLLTIQQSLVRRTIGQLSPNDLTEFETRLAALLLSDLAIAEYLATRVDLTVLSARLVQTIAEKAVQSLTTIRHHDL